MNQINQPLAVGRTGATVAVLAIILAIGMLPASTWAAATRPARQQALLHSLPGNQIAQDDSDDADSKDVPTSQVDKYITIYEAMQKDHSLTVDQAASKQGLTVAQFRDLENKIEADDTLRERVRKALRKAANPKAADSDSSDD